MVLPPDELSSRAVSLFFLCVLPIFFYTRRNWIAIVHVRQFAAILSSVDAIEIATAVEYQFLF